MSEPRRSGLPLPAGMALAMVAFAGNSLLCRLALRQTGIDPFSFTTIRLVSGALLLAWLMRRRAAVPVPVPLRGHWPSALALWLYAGAFSLAYQGLTAATGALLLFGAVQVTMVGIGLVRGERAGPRPLAGMALALGGLLWLLLPGVAAPPPGSAALMAVAGVAWGVYSLRGRGSTDALASTAVNFRLACVPALACSVLTWPLRSPDLPGTLYALASGALASAAGYALWYSILPRLAATQAATLQLSVPVLAAAGGVLLLGEALTARLLLAGALVLTGVAVVTRPAATPGPR